jgi:hypothetical protein
MKKDGQDEGRLAFSECRESVGLEAWGTRGIIISLIII